METFISIITNAAFIGIFTLIIGNMFNRGLQKQKLEFDNQLLKQKGEIDKEIEKLKRNLELEFSNELERLTQKRNAYIDLINTMAVFIGKRVDENERVEYQKKFLKAYDASWLWASDEVLLALSNYMQFKINTNNLLNELTQQEIQSLEKELFSECILKMRKDIGFTESSLTNEHYKFINF
ncbi:hypothetical protein [Solibacillus ferritrahens]|uniref:hypothetical protein n=1 Tax=Solibacillus ferritrahens TaxID=3098620 RepID=UPI0030086AA1